MGHVTHVNGHDATWHHRKGAGNSARTGALRHISHMNDKYEHVYINICIYVYMYASYKCIYTYIYTYIHIYMYIYTCMYIDTYIYTYIHKCKHIAIECITHPLKLNGASRQLHDAFNFERTGVQHTHESCLHSQIAQERYQ